MVRRIAAVHRCPRSGLRERGGGCDQSEQVGQYRVLRRCRHSRTGMLSVLAALCALRDHSGMSWAMAMDCGIAHTKRNSCDEQNAGMHALSAYSVFGVADGSSGLSAAGRGSSQMRLSSETKSMDFFVEGRGRSSAFLRPLPSFSTVEGMSGRLLAAVRPFSSICLCRTFSTALLQAL